MWRQVVIYGILLALAAVGLEWLRFRHVTRIDSTEIYIAILAIGFIALGIWVGRHLAQYGEDPRRPAVRETGGAEPDAGGREGALAGVDPVTDAGAYQFRPVTEADLPLLNAWRARPHVTRWWAAPPPDEIEETFA